MRLSIRVYIIISLATLIAWVPASYALDKTPITLKKVTITLTGPGKDDPVLQSTLTTLPIQHAQTLSLEQYKQDKRTLYDMAIARGYIHASYTEHEVRIDENLKSAQITLSLATNQPFNFGELRFSHTPFSEAFLMRFVPFKRGDRFNHEDLLLLQSRLIQSGYFTKVVIEPLPEEAKNNAVPIQVNLTTVKQQAYTFGIGYGTDTGARGLVGTQFNYLNQHGHRLKTTLNTSQRYNNLESQYIIPGSNPLLDSYQFTGNVFHLNTDAKGDSIAGKFSVGKHHASNRWSYTHTINALWERNFNIPDNLPTTNKFILYPSLQWSYKKPSEKGARNYGYAFDLLLRGASQNALSDVTFLQSKIRGNGLYHLNDRLTFKLRGEFGYTLLSGLDDLPTSLHFLAGGTQSIRGYDYQSIGPGRYLATGSAELHYAFNENWGAGIFFDAGSVFNAHEFHDNFKQGIGFVVTRQTPFGPVEAGLARGISKGGKSIQFVFNLGTTL